MSHLQIVGSITNSLELCRGVVKKRFINLLSDCVLNNGTCTMFLCYLPQTFLLPQSTGNNFITLCTIYKIVNSLMEFSSDIFIPRAASGHFASTSLYLQPFSHSNSYLFSFVPNTCSLWNKLPSSLRSSDCVLNNGTCTMFYEFSLTHV